ncbi:uncharacterized protein LOC116302202 [Actinia tenebrosa]|uniref:Uncharacterized protein LOC116302202 n=1 Tax=Actinia tenebrosa TaxID=6105 RepID=A0A6P8ILK2_ACTTE|nr:uncharacterized protein LOC116302202 [Actinia tenebrosa]
MSNIQSKRRSNRSIHWTHQYALLDKVSLPSPGHDEQRPKGEIWFIDLLPNFQIQENLVNRMAILVSRSRVITKYLKVFKPLYKVVVYHIPHQFSEEMGKKSNSCCLSVEFFNPNIAGEMAQLMKKNQSQYVPLSADGTSVETMIPFHGDQNLEERSRNVKWTFRDGECSADRLEGLDPEFADWHAKFTLYKAENKIFLNHASVGEISTTMASMNRTGKTNAAKDIDSHYNEYSEFHTCEVEAHICAAFMTKMHMSNMDDKPNVIIPDSSVPKSIKQSGYMIQYVL